MAIGPSNMPIGIEALDGNSSDKKEFHETIRKYGGSNEPADSSCVSAITSTAGIKDSDIKTRSLR